MRSKIVGSEAWLSEPPQPGDLVEFELGLGIDGKPDGRPRWNHDFDRGGTGIWCRGLASSFTPTGELLVDFLNPETGWSECWSFPQNGSSVQRTGWVRRFWTRPASCECGAVKVWGRGPHSVWCPMYTTHTSDGTNSALES